jgi:hypothetical protein
MKMDLHLRAPSATPSNHGWEIAVPGAMGGAMGGFLLTAPILGLASALATAGVGALLLGGIAKVAAHFAQREK